ncbi:MAG: class I SAM-dependent methyltransferase [Bryobacterales bacterium]|nr:class I SAM-dependent methyltransferase [Bryobacterales bacterium]
MTFERALATALREAGVAASPAALAAMRGHYELLSKWGRRINLTTVLDPVAAARRHYGEAAFLHGELPQAASVVDVGSGAGFPGIPFAILRPETHVTLVESSHKKAAFLMEAAHRIPNARVCPVRLQDWDGSADWALLRAVSPASVLGDLQGRVGNVAILGTRRPPPGPFAPWRGRPLPWGRSLRLWTASGPASSGDVPRETSAGR